MDKDFVYNTFKEITDQFDVYIMQLAENNYQFKLVKKTEHPRKPKVTLADVITRLDKLEKQINLRFEKQEKFNKTIITRLDNLVAKNHLIE